MWGEIMSWVFEDTKPTRLIFEYFVGQRKTDGAVFSLLSMANDP